MKTELAPTSSDLSLLPRADLPVIWDGFAAKAEQLRLTAETLTVTTIEQKAEMELARTTRLTLKQIRVEVEKKRIELGEGHLTEIQKINGAAKKIKEMIEPLEARLLHQEQFAERVEADRVVELTKRRNDEVRAIWPGCPGDFGKMSQQEYDALLARLIHDAEVMAEAKRKQAEAEAKLSAEREEQKLRDDEAKRTLAEAWAEARRIEQAVRDEAVKLMLAQQMELKAESDRLTREQAEKDAEASRLRAREQAERAEELKTVQAKADAQLAEARAEADRQQAENERIQAELEVQLANERAAKLAEAEAARKLALAPDVEKLRDFAARIQGVTGPVLVTPEGRECFGKVSLKFNEIVSVIRDFCQE